jgi:hypothetical protein
MKKKQRAKRRLKRKMAKIILKHKETPPLEQSLLEVMLEKFYNNSDFGGNPFVVPPVFGVHKISGAKMFIGDEPIGILKYGEIHGIETYSWGSNEGYGKTKDVGTSTKPTDIEKKIKPVEELKRSIIL